jgi:ATP-dependent RNA helicase DDX6/DHH1
MADSLSDQLRATTLGDSNSGSAPAPSESWKNELKIPAKDNRHQTEVGGSQISRVA